MIDLKQLKLEFCKWVETLPVVTDNTVNTNEFMYFKKGDGTYYQMEITKIPIKFKVLLGKN